MKQFKTESKRILDLMVNSIYTNKEIFLRELISNASDAIDKLKFISLTDGSVNTDFKIKLSIDKAARTLTIEDNGIGMSEEELEKNLGTIAESGTLAFKKENDDKNGELIGQFGVGFYSAFMVADKIEVYSKKYGEDKAHKWTSAGAEGYTIEETEKEGFGTKIVITIKPDGEDYDYCEFLDEYKIIRLVKEYSDYIRYPIEMPVTRSRKKEGSPDDKPEYEDYTEIQILNSMVPLWKKPKAEVTDEKLAEFYKNEFHDYEAPVKSIYAKIEGTVSFDALLFVPARAPYNFYSKDYKRGLKLYSNGVMIMEACEDLLPDYLGFVKGVIESPDLSLNISREILQQDRQVKAIASSVEKKIIAELKKMQESERENYEKLFDTFGLSLKFGVYSGFGINKDKLKDLLLFRSSKTGGAVTLKEYVETLPEGQTEILYACGESYDNGYGCKRAGVGQHGLAAETVAEQCVVGQALEQTKQNAEVTGPTCDLLTAFLAAVLYHALKSGDGNSQQLKDDGCVDIRGDGHCEDGRTRQTTAGEHIQITKHRTVYRCLLEVLCERYGINERNRNARTKAEDQDDEQSVQHLLAQFGHRPGVFKGLKHLKPPRPFRLRLRSSPLRTQRKQLP